MNKEKLKYLNCYFIDEITLGKNQFVDIDMFIKYCQNIIRSAISDKVNDIDKFIDKYYSSNRIIELLRDTVKIIDGKAFELFINDMFNEDNFLIDYRNELSDKKKFDNIDQFEKYLYALLLDEIKFYKERLEWNEEKRVIYCFSSAFYPYLAHTLLKQMDTEKLFSNFMLANDFSKIKNLKIGESLPFSESLLHSLSHSNDFIPIIYVNGNVISSQDFSTNRVSPTNGRLYHAFLVDEYLENMSLHKNDIIKQTEEEWRSTSIMSPIVQGIRAVMKDGVIFIIGIYTEQGVDAIANRYHYPVICFTDDANKMLRKARLVKKVLKKGLN